MCCSSSSNQRSVIIHHFHSLALQQQNCIFREVVVISTRSPVKKKKREKCKLIECVFIPAIYVCHFHPLALHPSYSWYVACTHYLRDARAERGKGSGWENRGWGGGGRQQGDRGRSANTSVDIKITLPAQSAWCLGEGPEAFSCLCFQT
jgi:hypothetical protein